MQPAPKDPETVRLSQASAGQPRILVVENDAAFAELVRWELATSGYRVRVARSVGDARQILRDEIHPDLIVSDVRMSDGLGFELLWCEQLDEVRVPVVLMSGFPSLELREFAEAAGAVLLAKPFDFDELRAVVHHVLSQTGQRLVSIDFADRRP